MSEYRKTSKLSQEKRVNYSHALFLKNEGEKIQGGHLPGGTEKSPPPKVLGDRLRLIDTTRRHWQSTLAAPQALLQPSRRR